tara:strand:- start:2792 stop:4204 length:1413 start_codon:yes stop_codon:yes gene_type:complete
MNKKITRKSFIKKASILSISFAGLSNYLLSNSLQELSKKTLSLTKDSNGILNLPEGFKYTIISKFKDKMNDGLIVPNHADGMGCFKIDKNRVALIRNHELGRFEEYNFNFDFNKSAFAGDKNQLNVYPKNKIYDNCNDGTPCFGGTTTIIYNIKTAKIENQYLSLAGTLVNCSGGQTPWGTWISCEETVAKKNNFLLKNHGYNFEVVPNVDRITTKPVPLKDMGRFRHEAVAFQKDGLGVVYQTEDRNNGLIYRFIPNNKTKLEKGGKLQGLCFTNEFAADTRNWDQIKIKPGDIFDVKWIDLENVQSPDDDLRTQGHDMGCAIFARGEGMWEHNGEVFFTCTTGGKKQLGQIWKYTPSTKEGFLDENKIPGKLELFFESESAKSLDKCDNMTIAPNGDLIVCEDGNGSDRIIGIRKDGSTYQIGKNILNNSELAGACFSPDGKILFVNIYKPTMTLAISGDWLNLSNNA